MRLLSFILSKIRYIKWGKRLKQKKVKIVGPSNIMGFQNISIGNNVYIGPGSYIMAKGGLSIGDNVIIGPRLTVWTENHNFRSEHMIPYDSQDVLKPVWIGANVWIGLGVILCPGAEIGEGSIIGTGAVVRGKVPPCSIVTGNPGKVVGSRNEELYYKLLEEGKIFTWHTRGCC